jgi:DNA modification methylase
VVQLRVVNIHSLVVLPNRQRREFKPEEVIELADSISQNGLIHPLVVRQDGDKIVLVAGERRLRAMVYVWNFGNPVRCGTEHFSEGQVPCLYQGDLDPLDAMEMELEENIRRTDLTWQERASAASQVYELRRLQAEKKGEPPPTFAEVAEEVNESPDQTRKEILLSRHLDDPDVAKAKTADEAYKVVKRKEELQRSKDLGELVGRTFNSSIHVLTQGDCLVEMRALQGEYFDVILTDPPYGIDADQYGDSGGMTPGAHFYDDSVEAWSEMVDVFATQSFRLAKPQAHLYVFCDIDRFSYLKDTLRLAGWRVFRTPLIWVNPSAMRAPWPEHGPQRKWQMILYAVKGNRHVMRLYPDILTFASDSNLGHNAQKPVAVYEDLLRRSVQPGDTVLDPFCGTGTIFPAAHGLQCKAVGIEIDAASYGIAVQRLKDLE